MLHHQFFDCSLHFIGVFEKLTGFLHQCFLSSQLQLHPLQVSFSYSSWHPPLNHWWTTNLDGSFHHSQSLAGRGGIVRDHHGKSIFASANSMVAHQPLEAELHAFLQGFG